MSSTPTAAAGAPAPFTHRQIMAILSGLLLGMFLAALDQTIVSTAIRTIADDLQGFDLQAWATTAFLITSTISTPLYGKLSDTYGRRPFFMAAIVIFVVGSLLCGFAGSMYELAAFRALQGLGAGGLMSLALTIVGDIVPARERAKYQAYFMAVFGISSVLGPVIGGFFAGHETILGITGWKWIFWINVPIGIAAMLVVYRNLHLPKPGIRHRLDWPGALALVVALVPLLVVAEQGRDWGWGSTAALACYAVGAAGIVAFVLAERAMGDEALLPLRLFRNRTFQVGTLGSFIMGMGMFGGFAVLPQYLQIAKGSTPTEGGLQMLPLTLGIIVASAVSGQVIARTGRYKPLPVIGSALMAVALLLFSLVTADTPIWQTMLVMVLLGMGLGGNMQPIILAVQNASSPREIGVATSSVTFFRQMGGTLGTAVFLSILFSTLGDRVAEEYQKAARTPEFASGLQDAGLTPAQLQERLGEAMSDTSLVAALPSVLSHPFKTGFSDATSVIFLVAAATMVLGTLVVAFLPALPLRSGSAMAARGAGAPAGGGGAGAPKVATAAGAGQGTEGVAGSAAPLPSDAGVADAATHDTLGSAPTSRG
ncbi:MDR family MFS transporter [Kineococcus sp. NUM-3379]